MAKMANAVALEATWLGGPCGFESRRPHYFLTRRSNIMAESDSEKEEKPTSGRPEQPLRIPGDWEEAVKKALKVPPPTKKPLTDKRASD